MSHPALRALVALALLLMAGRVHAQEDGYVVPSLVRLFAGGSMEALVDEAFAADWDVVSRGDGYVEVMMPRSEALELGRLRRGGAIERVEILLEDADEPMKAFADRPDAGAYHTYAEVLMEVDALQAAHPELLRRETVGTSLEGRQIVALELTGPGAASGRPATLITGLHHAREWISVEVPMATVEMLVQGYGRDPWVTQVMDTRRIWVIPVVNPDGHVYSQTKSRMWRKNRAKNSWGATGVDPNRNYGYQWGGAGASGNPWSDTYRGPEAFSEPETRAVRDLALREGFVSSLSFHSYSELVLWPWGYTYDPSPDEATLKQHGDAMATLNGYKPMKSSGLYRTSGDFCDWFYGQTGALTYTIELGKQFVPREDEIPGIVAANLKAVRYFLEHTVTPAR